MSRRRSTSPASHGWPWTFWHRSKVIDPLADPAAFGDEPADAFDVIVPSLPGFGFSTPLTNQPDMSFWKIADVWHELMTGVLGYERYAAGGCDVGALVTGQLGHKESASPSTWQRTSSTQPRLVTGLADSPAGMLAWILERWTNWSDNGGGIENVFTKDDLLTHATIYWAGNAIDTSIRTYANNNRYPWTPSHTRWPVIEAPTSTSLLTTTAGTSSRGKSPTSGSKTYGVHSADEAETGAGRAVSIQLPVAG